MKEYYYKYFSDELWGFVYTSAMCKTSEGGIKRLTLCTGVVPEEVSYQEYLNNYNDNLV